MNTSDEIKGSKDSSSSHTKGTTNYLTIIDITYCSSIIIYNKLCTKSLTISAINGTTILIITINWCEKGDSGERHITHVIDNMDVVINANNVLKNNGRWTYYIIGITLIKDVRIVKIMGIIRLIEPSKAIESNKNVLISMV